MTDTAETLPETMADASDGANQLRQIPAGVWCAAPIGLLLLAGFLAPLIMVVLFSFMPRGTFSPFGVPTLENYVDIFTQKFYISFGWSLFLALISTAILMVVSYPLAVAIRRAAPRRALVLTILIVAPLFVAENIRLQGWVLFLDKAGVLDGSVKALTGFEIGSLVTNVPAIVFGIVYVYLPFMLFPMIMGLANVPPDVKEAASDLGASRWQMFRDIELPLAAPGLLIGGLLCFVISLGAFSEAKFLGKGVVVTIAQDIESAFTFGQNWPRGSALSALVIILAGAAVYLAMRRLDLEKMLGRAS
ncbi:ABC transporter permease [uncultured Roseobacter sp.]|uniref:ABC transporter permease n=1 Tax=uncultured Roseobacter sp. TaxID=114847 RepID=UPI002607DED3|nr:ABC transporter permease [uncultured Roseobacter sp.]